jgi:ATP-dependent RNA helicase SUPV3L1/SUV3
MMVEGEATQEPIAPEGAPKSPLAESTSPLADSASPVLETAPEPAAETPEVSAETELAETASAEPEAPAEVHAPAELEAPVETGPARDWSHLRGLQTVESPAEAGEDYPEALKKELAARATRFARSVDESIVLSSEGLMRWLGDPVARVVAGDELLAPRAVLLADEALEGEERAAVETRVALWLSAHIRKLLGPLVALSEGAELSEAGRALGAKISEALGVLEREGVRNEVRALDQTARGALRKLGVRFGSLYIYVPVLLKPGARGLCSLLWTLRRGSEANADRLLAFASAGRTSFANEGLVSPDAYRVAGFRLCGERVVRVDIIERLSDLIRAALPDHMRSGSRPASEAYGFLVTPQMTSLTGCSGEAFASILRSLGFEPVRVSKAAFAAANAKAPTEPIKPAVTEAEAVSEAAHEIEATAEAETPETEAATEIAPEAAHEVEAASEEEAAPEVEAEPTHAVEEAVDAEPVLEAEAAPEAEQAPETAAEAAAEGVVDAEAAEPAMAGEAAPESAEAAAVAEEEIEIWRPAPRRPRAQRPPRTEEDARPHRGRPQHRRDGRPPQAAQASEERPQDQAQHRPHRQERRDDSSRRPEGGDENRPKKDFAPKRDFGSRKDFGSKQDLGPKRDFGPKGNAGPRRDQRPVDPDSPFAKLAALKPLLERRDKRP